MKYHLEYSNGKKLSIAGYLRALGKTQNIEDWKKEHGDFWHIEYKKWLQQSLAKAVLNLDLVIS